MVLRASPFAAFFFYDRWICIQNFSITKVLSTLSLNFVFFLASRDIKNFVFTACFVSYFSLSLSTGDNNSAKRENKSRY